MTLWSQTLKDLTISCEAVKSLAQGKREYIVCRYAKDLLYFVNKVLERRLRI